MHRRLWTATVAIAALAAPLGAQTAVRRSPPPAPRPTEYQVGGGTLRITPSANRVDALLWDGKTAVLVALDPPAIDRWANAASVLANARSVPRTPAERETPKLSNSDSSFGSWIVLTRVPHGRGTRLYLSAALDADHLALVDLSDLDARVAIAALRNGAVEARRVARF